MWTRIKTALILVIIVGIALFASEDPYLIIPLLAVGVTIASYEWAKLMPIMTKPILFAVFMLCLSMLTLLLPSLWPVWWGASIAIWLMALYWVIRFPASTNWYGLRLAVIGIIIITSAICAMYYLWQISAWWLLYVFLLVWCADSGAYFVGSKFGRRKMSPHVSPNKSIEGLLGGLVTGLIVVVAISLFKLNLTGMQLSIFVVISLITILASVLGDLFESMLKRKAGTKDSGTFLPGHGGLLDRIDSLLSATPIFALSIWGCQKLGWLLL